MRDILKHIFLLVLFAVPVKPQNATFVASTDRTTVGISEQFEVSFTASGSDVNAVKNFHAPTWTPFVVLSGPNQSTNVQFVNGQVSGSVTFTYYLYAASNRQVHNWGGHHRA